MGTMIKTDQLAQLEKAYQGFVGVVNDLSAEAFLSSLGDWTPRDIVAHLIGWNRNILVGCQQIQLAQSPFYHSDGANDYRTLNAELIARYSSSEREPLLRELSKGKDLLTSYLEGVDEDDWERNFGPQHYRGGPATIARSVESLTRDYVDHADEIVGQQAARGNVRDD
jgi:hypothetical protein